jgi:tRNA uridine 5-carbamoylmethylation protein Kti12
MIIVRGCPGSGKSTLAKALLALHGYQVVHVEADMYFERERLGYQFNFEELNSAHRWCLNSTKIMLNTRNQVIVSNTFTRFREMIDYVEFALNNNFTMHIYSCTSEFQNQHNVPEDKLKQMRERFQPHSEIMKSISELYCAEHLPY